MTKNLCELLHRLSLNDDVCEQQRAKIENDFYRRISNDQNKRYWKPVERFHETKRSL